MVKREEIRKGWKKLNDQLNEAKRFLDEKKLDEALYFTWLAAENIVNTLKVVMDGFYLKDHKAKFEVLKEYFILGTLKRDYSGVFEKISKYRIVAEFHPYTSIPKDYTEKDVEGFLEKIKELREEVGIFLTKRGVLR